MYNFTYLYVFVLETKCFNNKMQNKIILITIGTYPTNQVANAKNE